MASHVVNALSHAKEALSLRQAYRLVDALLKSSDDEFLLLLQKQLEETSHIDERSGYWANIVAEAVRTGVRRWDERSEGLLTRALAKDAFRLAVMALVSKRLAEVKRSKRAQRPK